MEPFERIKPDSEIPKYKQVCDLIVNDIESGIFKQGQKIPSINETSEELLLSRDTVEKAYISLKKKGVLVAVKGKGYFVNRTGIHKKFRIALVFNKLSNYKRSIYYSLSGSLGSRASVDVFIYNHSLSEFESIVENNLNHYDFFVILPHFGDEKTDYQEVIKRIPREKVIIADRFPENLKEYPVVYQEFENDIQSALDQALTLLKKYKRINLVFPSDQYYSKRIVKGFQIFCQVNSIPFAVIDSLSREKIRELEAYVIVTDDDLYNFIKMIREKGWRLGNQVGVVAYNDNPVKEILEDGITTISTNHDMIGRLIAQMILTRDFRQIRIPFRFIERKSL